MSNRPQFKLPAPDPRPGADVYEGTGEARRARILLVTIDPAIGPVLLGPLQQEGYQITLVEEGRRALERTREVPPPSLVIVDLDLPDMRGTDLFRAIRHDRATRAIPILVLTARDTEADRVVAFELGADDFVGAPFSVREVLLRVRVHLKGRAAVPAFGNSLEVGVLRLDREAHRAWVNGREVALSVREFRLLEALMERSERVLSRHTLLDLVWGTTANVGVRAVDAYITRLRKKLGEVRDYVETVSSVGYRLRRPQEHPRSRE